MSDRTKVMYIYEKKSARILETKYSDGSADVYTKSSRFQKRTRRLLNLTAQRSGDLIDAY